MGWKPLYNQLPSESKSEYYPHTPDSILGKIWAYLIYINCPNRLFRWWWLGPVEEPAEHWEPERFSDLEGLMAEQDFSQSEALHNLRAQNSIFSGGAGPGGRVELCLWAERKPAGEPAMLLRLLCLRLCVTLLRNACLQAGELGQAVALRWSQLLVRPLQPHSHQEQPQAGTWSWFCCCHQQTDKVDFISGSNSLFLSPAQPDVVIPSCKSTH